MPYFKPATRRSSELLVMCLALGLVLGPGVLHATPVNMGQAGPQNWGILEIGNGNVSLANAANTGFVSGNIGVKGTGTISDGGSLPITGNAYLGTAAGQSGLAGNVSGSILQNAASQASLNQAAADALAAASLAAGMASAGGGVGITSISSGGILAAGVYNLTSLVLNNKQLTLNGDSNSHFIFNISGSLSLNGSQIFLSGGLTADNVLFNITGSQAVQFAGGLNQESVLNGIILAPNSNVQVTPGAVNGEIISGANINIASGGSVNDVPPSSVPDAGSTLFLLGLGFTGLAMFARRSQLLTT